MKCGDLQFNLSLYFDDSLSPDESAKVESHLTRCPLCRQALSEFQEIRNNLRTLPRPEIPASVVNTVRSSLAAKTNRPQGTLSFPTYSAAAASYRVWLMSYGIGAAASVILGFGFLWIILLSGSAIVPGTASTSRTRILLADSSLDKPHSSSDLTPTDYAHTRSTVASESPSINPNGSLIELTKSLVSGEMKDDEVVVVADVFENGSAQIAEVVEPSRNGNAVDELARALDYENANMPFVPATLDQRSETIRVVLKIQSVYVSTKERPRRSRSL